MRGLFLLGLVSLLGGCQIVLNIGDLPYEPAPDGAGGQPSEGGSAGVGGPGAAGSGGDAQSGAAGQGGEGGEIAGHEDGGMGGAGSPSAGSSGSSGQEATSGAAGFAGLGGGGAGGVAATGCVPGEAPLDGDGYFVAPSGDDGPGNNGSRQLPFASVQKAILAAKNGEKHHVYLAPGTYSEELLLQGVASALALEGGWNVDPVTHLWARDCAEAARLGVILTLVEGGPIVRIEGNPSEITLRTLTVVTAPSVASSSGDVAGRSQLGVLVNDSGPVVLEDIEITAGDAGDAGPPAEKPTAATETAPCDGVADCKSGKEGGPTEALEPGVFSFSSDGFVPGDGADGPEGMPGEPGTPGGAGQDAPAGCGDCGINPPCQFETLISEGEHGVCGCGGRGGKGGKGGKGGGASVALLVASPASVKLSRSRLRAGNGGDGAPGGVGGDGAPGAPGAPGAQTSCDTACVVDIGPPKTCEGASPLPLQGGESGGVGGPGGTGAPGSPGMGGPSYAVVVVGEVSLDVTSSELLFASGGKRGDGALEAEAATVKPF